MSASQLRRFIKLLVETQAPANQKFYWMSNRPWKNGDPIGQHVPRMPKRDSVVERIFEEVRLEIDPNLPSRLNCAFICDSIGKGSFCNPTSYTEILRPGYEIFVVKLKGPHRIHKANSEVYTEASIVSHDVKEVREWAKRYWWWDDNPTFGEILVTPPSAAIIVDRHHFDKPIDKEEDSEW